MKKIIFLFKTNKYINIVNAKSTLNFLRFLEELLSYLDLQGYLSYRTTYNTTY